MKVLHLPTSVGGNAWGLAQAEKKIGLESTVLTKYDGWPNYKSDICLHFEKKKRFYQRLITASKTFLEIKNKYNIFHFNYGSSLIDFPEKNIHLLDLPFYKGKKIMTFNGCDARQKYPTMERTNFSACHQHDCYGGICNSGKMDIIRRKRIEIISKYVDHIFALNPDLMYFLPKDKTTFLPYTVAAWNDIQTYSYEIKDKIKILHAPSNRASKGTKYILDHLEKLKKKYKNLEIILVEKLPYSEAIKLYQEAHIVIDQVLIGWYGAFGVEVMKMGKPLAVFIRKEDLKFIPSQMAKDLQETIININPYNIEEELSKYIENPKLLYEKSQTATEYVNKWHNPIYVANLVIEFYN